MVVLKSLIEMLSILIILTISVILILVVIVFEGQHSTILNILLSIAVFLSVGTFIGLFRRISSLVELEEKIKNGEMFEEGSHDKY